MGSNNKSGNQIQDDDMERSRDEKKENSADWDNDTYGHSPDASLFKRKDEPDNAHLENLKDISDEERINASDELKNINLSKDDLSQGAAFKEKGIGGKSQ